MNRNNTEQESTSTGEYVVLPICYGGGKEN